MTKSIRILVVDDDRLTCQTVAAMLEERGYRVDTRESATAALELLREEDFEIIVTDLQMQQVDGIQLCQEISENRPDIPVVIMTAHGSLPAVTAAMRAGAYDFVTKPFEVELLELAIERARKHRRLHVELLRLQSDTSCFSGAETIIGRSRPIVAMKKLIGLAAARDSNVLITGESGTGKELVARAIHGAGRRAKRPFLAVNCAAISEQLLESELFGHVEGAFTDANKARDGLFIAADGGTIFLDEIGDMPIGMQVKLLRAIQERSVRPVGGTRETKFDTRVLAATNRDIETDVEEGRFRLDLFYRLNVLRIDVPPLRTRANDVLVLAQHFLSRSEEAKRRHVEDFSHEAIQRLSNYPFPGNARELQNAVERAVAMCSGFELQLQDFPDAIRFYTRHGDELDTEALESLFTMDQLERRYVRHVIEAHAGNKTAAAVVLRMDRKTLYRRLLRWAQEDRERGRPE